MDFFDSPNISEIVQNIKEIILCPFCGANYLEEHIKILAKYKRNYIIHLLCYSCGKSVIAGFSYKHLSSQKPDKIIDAKLEEMAYFIEKGSISDDEVMDFYKAMRNFDGDFKKFFPNKNNKNQRKIL